MLSRKNRFFVLLPVLCLLLCLAGCDSSGQSLFPGVGDGETTQPGEDTVPETTAEPSVQQLPAYAKELAAVQCFYQGQLQREYSIAYGDQGRVSVLKIYTYDNGTLYSWGENHYEYDEQGNLTVNDYVYSLGTQRWEYENEYDDQGVLTGYQETEYYNGNLVSQHREDCFYDRLGRYLGNIQPENVTFDEYGRVLTMEVRVARGDYLADMDVTCDYSNQPMMLCRIHTVFPEYEQFSTDLRLMLNDHHVLFGLDMKDGYQLITDDQGFLTRVADENGSDIYVFIYN